MSAPSPASASSRTLTSRLQALPESTELLALLAIALVWRALWWPGRYIELDSSIYIQAASDYAHHLLNGNWRTLPLTNANYTAIEYWPPLYPFLGGLATLAVGSAETGVRLVSLLAGWLTVLAVYVIGRRLFNREVARWSAAIVCFSPQLSWYGTVARSEPLDGLLLLGGLACAFSSVWEAPPLPSADASHAPPLPSADASHAPATESNRASEEPTRPGPPPDRRVSGGLCAGFLLALAYMTRFEVLADVACCAVAMVVLERRRAWPAVTAMLGAFVLTATPYIGYLSHLAGHLALTPQKKWHYDTLEATWRTLALGRQDQFVSLVGPPGAARFTPEILARFPTLPSSWWILHCLEGIPGGCLAAARNWSWPVVVLALATVLRTHKDRRTIALLLMFVPAPAIMMASFWDPAPRYYAYTVPLLALLAAPSIERLANFRPQRCSLRDLWWMGGLPFLFACDIYVPGSVHFDIGMHIAPTALPPHATAMRWISASCATLFGLARVDRSTARARPPWSGVSQSVAVTLVATAGLGLGGISRISACFTLFAVGCALWPAIAPRYGVRVSGSALWLIVAVFNLVTMRMADAALLTWLRIHPH